MSIQSGTSPGAIISAGETPAGAPVTSVFGRIGAVVAVPGDYGSDDITNESGVAGATVSNALDQLDSYISTLTSDDIANASTVVGATVTDALDTLNTGLGAISLQSAYDGGNIIVTTPGTPVTIDELFFEDSTISAPAGSAILIIAGDGDVVTPNGGDILIESGDGFADSIAGTIYINAGDSPGLAQGGGVTFQAGDSVGSVGGTATVGAGSGISGGPVSIFGGTGLGVGGDINIFGGEGADLVNGNGGSVSVLGGAGHGTGGGGIASIAGGSHDGLGGQGGGAELSGGSSSGSVGGLAQIRGGNGGIDGADGFVGGQVAINGGFGGNATAGGTAGNGGQIFQSAGDGGDATGAGAIAGNGGLIDISGGSAGTASGGATPGTGGSVNISSGSGDTEVDAGSVQVGLALGTGGPTDPLGGWYLDPTNGRLSLRTYTVGGVDAGSLRLHQVDLAGEAVQAVDDGLLHFQTEQDAGIETTVGFRAAKSGNYGLMARVYQQTIDATGTYVVTHNLNCNAPVVAVYNAAGTYIATFAVVQNSLDQITITAVVAGGGFATVIGF